MKKLLTLTGLLISTLLFSQAPQKIHYQAVIRDGSGAVVSNQTIALKLEILQGPNTYTEIRTITTNNLGLVNLDIGSVPAPNSSPFTEINWAAGNASLITWYDPTNTQSNWQYIGNSTIASVPYALYAENGFSGDFNDLTNVPNLDTSNTNELQVLSLSGDTLFLSNGGFVVLPSIGGGGGSTGYEIGDLGPAGGVIVYKKRNTSNGWKYIELCPKYFFGSLADTIFPVDSTVSYNFQYDEADSVGYGDLTFNFLKSKLSQYNINSNIENIIDTLSFGGYSDWYLPNDSELLVIFERQNAIIASIGNDHMFRASNYSDPYYCSSEVYYRPGNFWGPPTYVSQGILYDRYNFQLIGSAAGFIYGQRTTGEITSNSRFFVVRKF